MVVETATPATDNALSRIAALYEDPSYWRGGVRGDGYAGAGYQDFPVNQTRAEYIARLRPQSVLDVGCASGYLVGRLRRRGIEAWGVDVSAYAIGQAGEDTRPYLRRAWAHELPYGDRTMDLVVSFGVLEHLPPDLVDRTLAELRRVGRRGLLSISLATDPMVHRSEHPSLHDYAWWRARLPPSFEVMSDAMESWSAMTSDWVLLVSTGILPVGPMGYGGIERLVALFARGLRGHYATVKVVAPQGSVLPTGVALVESGPPADNYGEPTVQGAVWSAIGRQNAPPPTTILDFSHAKHAGFAGSLPSLNPIWHDPKLMETALAPYNVVALSEWQAERLRQYRRREARVLDPIVVDTDYFVPGGVTEDRLLFIGKLHPTKGCHEAIRLAKKYGFRLDIVGPVTAGDPKDYVDAVLRECDGDRIVYWGEVSDEAKLRLTQRAKALVYPVSYAPGFGESHSHKSTEAMGCGTPSVLRRQGAMGEVVDEGVTGFLYETDEEFAAALKGIETLDRTKVRQKMWARWSVPATMARWMPVIRTVARGLRW